MKPLVCEALSTTRPSTVERVLMWIPFLGWMIAHAMENARFKPIIREIEDQLLARPDTSSYWTCRNESSEFTRLIRVILAKELGWPNDHFLPEDPMEILLWAHRDGLDGVFAIQAIEKEMSVRVLVEKFESFSTGGTLGEFVDWLISLKKHGVMEQGRRLSQARPSASFSLECKLQNASAAEE